MRVLVLLSCLLGAVPAAAQMTPLSVLSCTAANFPDCGGWQPRPTNAYWSRRFILGGGPHGQNAVEITNTPVTTAAQYYLGWGGVTTLPNPAQGTVRYLRMRFKTVGPVNPAGVADAWTNKFIIVADGDNPTGRIICHLRDHVPANADLGISCSRNIDGYPNATQSYVTLPSDQWVNLQFEFKSSTTMSSGNGSLKIWKNSDVYGSPSTQSGAFQLNAIGWGFVSVGSYANMTLRAGGRVVYQLADVVWDDAFDANWTGATPVPQPAPPTNVQIIVAGLGLIPIVGLLRRRSLR